MSGGVGRPAEPEQALPDWRTAGHRVESRSRDRFPRRADPRRGRHREPARLGGRSRSRDRAPAEGTGDAPADSDASPSGDPCVDDPEPGLDVLCKGPGRGPAGQPAGPGDEPLPAPARPQPGGLVSVGARGVRQGQGREQADLPVGRLQLVLLVPRHGARELRGRRDRQGPQRELRLHQGRPRGAARTSTRSTWPRFRRSGRAAGRCRCS